MDPGTTPPPPFSVRFLFVLKKHLSFDIHLFLEYDLYFTVLISRSVCISRTPGFSKSQGLLDLSCKSHLMSDVY